MDLRRSETGVWREALGGSGFRSFLPSSGAPSFLPLGHVSPDSNYTEGPRDSDVHNMPQIAVLGSNMY